MPVSFDKLTAAHLKAKALLDHTVLTEREELPGMQTGKHVLFSACQIIGVTAPIIHIHGLKFIFHSTVGWSSSLNA